MTGYMPGGEYQPPPAGYSPIQPQKLRPGRIWYLVGLVIFLAGAAWLVVGILSAISTVNDLQRVPLPAGGTVSLQHSGGYIIYYEGQGAQSGRIPAFHINVTPASPGAAVTGLSQYRSTVTYNIGSHQGRAVLTLHVAKPGKFAIKATGAPVADLAIGGSIARGIVGVVLPGVPLMILGFLGLAIVLIIRLVRKSALRRSYP
jgi:hypothetical protein